VHVSEGRKSGVYAGSKSHLCLRT